MQNGTRVNSVRLVTVALAAFFATSPASAQSSPPVARDAVYFEAGGNALLYSFNYDRRFRDDVTGRVGLMLAHVSAGSDQGDTGSATVAFIPLMVSKLIGTGAGRLELGAGPVLGYVSGDVSEVGGSTVEFSGLGLAAISSTIGYRYQPESGGLVFRAGLTPFYSDYFDIWAGLSIGYAF